VAKLSPTSSPPACSHVPTSDPGRDRSAPPRRPRTASGFCATIRRNRRRKARWEPPPGARSSSLPEDVPRVPNFCRVPSTKTPTMCPSRAISRARRSESRSPRAAANRNVPVHMSTSPTTGISRSSALAM
jgi:hypothetical protein